MSCSFGESTRHERDTGGNIKHNPTTHAIARQAKLLVKMAGGKEEAIRQIRAVKVKGNVGRPKGLPYRQIDSQLLSLVDSLRYEWLFRGRPLPTRHLLTKKIVELCWQDVAMDREGRRQGCWNCEVCERLALAQRGSARLGTDPDATVKRLDSRKPPPIAGIDPRYFRDFGFLGTPWDPLWSGDVVNYEPPSWLWEEFHRARPELQLLPD